MSVNRADLVDVNRCQDGSDTDDFTLERYAQFLGHFPSNAQDVLDIGCNTGRGGQYLKSQMPTLRLVGLDCVADRLEKINPNIYDRTICGFTDDIALPGSSFSAIV